MSFPIFKSPFGSRLEFNGIIGERIVANQENWLLVAPSTNPGMLNMLCDRENNHDLIDWSGEFAGKYLISAVQYVRITQDMQLKHILKQFVEKLISCQDPEGYLGPFSSTKDRMHRWDLWGQYHCMLGLFLYYQEFSDEEALKACCKTANLFCDTYIDTGKRVYFASCGNPPSEYCWPEVHEACIHIFTLLFQDTNPLINEFRNTYRRMITEIEQDWELLDSGNYVNFFQQDNMFYNCSTHRWESLHNVQAIAELYFITGDERYRIAFQHIWDSILSTDRHNNGGFASGEEATGNPYDPRPIETCATIAWMAVNIDMLRISGDPHAADELELSTWNAVLGSSPDGSWWTYNTPMGGIPSDGMDHIPAISPMDGVPPILGERRRSTFDLWWQASEGTSQLSCCSANGPRGLGFLSEWAVMLSDDGIVLNYYGPSTFVVWTPSGQIVKLEQITDYPKSGKVSLIITPESEESFLLRLRIPWWSRNTIVSINGEPHPHKIHQGTYLLLNRLWKLGDKIDIELDMSPHFWVGRPPPENSKGEGSAEGKVSVYHGPLLLAYDSHFDLHASNKLPFIDLTSTPREIDSSHTNTVEPFILLQFDTVNQKTVTLCDFASAGANGMPYVSWLPVIDKTWLFGRLDGTVIAKSIRLLADGRILGHNNDNEFRWDVEGDTLVFFSRDGRPSTRFDLLNTINGRLVLRGTFLFDQTITHILTEMDWGITNKIWQFRRLDGTMIAKSIRLLADGRILGHNNDNEFRWDVEGDTLVFFGRDGKQSTRFDLIRTINEKFQNETEFRFPFNGLLLQGQSLFNPNITHLLIEKDPSWGSPDHSLPKELQIQPYREFKHSSHLV